MSGKKLHGITLVATLMAAASAAQAGFVPMGSNGPATHTIDIVSNNDFKSILAAPAIGVTNYTFSASLGVDTAGTVSYYYYGKEAGYDNIFSAGGHSYESGFSPTSQNKFASPILIGSLDVAAGVLDFGFCSYSAPGSKVGCISNAQNDWLDYGAFQSIAFNASGNLAWIFWDDSGGGPDDNHDDMLIKAVFTPRSVPEPATLGLFGLGLLGVWSASRRRKSAANLI